MSEKQFTLEQWTKHSLYYSDGEYSAHMSIGFICEKVEKNLNEQQATIEEQNKEIEEWEFSFRTEMAHHRVAEKELQEKIREQQATIEEYKDFCLNLCKFLIQKDFVDEYREKYGKEYKIITKWW